MTVGDKQLVKTVSWYDNEMSYTAQYICTLSLLRKLIIISFIYECRAWSHDALCGSTSSSPFVYYHRFAEVSCISRLTHRQEESMLSIDNSNSNMPKEVLYGKKS